MNRCGDKVGIVGQILRRWGESWLQWGPNLGPVCAPLFWGMKFDSSAGHLGWCEGKFLNSCFVG